MKLLATGWAVRSTLAFCIAVGFCTACVADALHDARTLFLSGKYAEAEEAYSKLLAKSPLEAALGQARCQRSQGRLDDARKTLELAQEKNPRASAPVAELAQLAFERGDYRQAKQSADAALKIDPNTVLARWIQAECFRTSGKLEEADKAYRELVGYYNDHDVTDPDDLRWIGRAAGQFARWHRLSDQFSFLVNELYPAALAKDDRYWPARYESGLLFMEKYNQPAAVAEFEAALVLNPNAAEVRAAQAGLALQSFELEKAQAAIDRALEINPKLLAAFHAQADLHLANVEPDKAAEILRLALQVHPASEQTLGRLAGAYAAIDGTKQTDKGSRIAKIVEQVEENNPHPGDFYVALGGAFDKLRRFPASARYYRDAMRVMPQLGAARGELGLVLMRLGEETEARRVLTDAFEADPFNVRVSNSIKVLEVLDDYETLETEHFIIKFDGKRDKILADYVARELEDCYRQLTKQFGFEPQGKSLFEIFSRAKNTDGHGWFAARMVGLPQLHTIGACAGQMVALESPNDGRQKFNWARVVKHEFVHLMNLQQTDFNIPHWYTEALAVYNEGYPRPDSWNELLAERVRSGKLFNLDTINLGFVRPRSSTEWTLAYCQAELYAEYMLERFGKDALAKLLAGYADNLNTRAALQRAFAVEQPDFETGYTAYLKKLVADLPANSQPRSSDLAELERKVAAEPENCDVIAELAHAHLDRRSYPQARKLAEQALKINARHQHATYVRARLHLLIGDDDVAAELLAAALDPDNPQTNLLALLAQLKLKAGDNAEAIRLYELGAKRYPADVKWIKSLSAIALKTGNNTKLVPALTKLSERDADEVGPRKKLAQLAFDAERWGEARDWARRGLEIDVMDVELHSILGRASARQDDHAVATRELEVAMQLGATDAPLILALVESYVKSGQAARAKPLLDKMPEDSPERAKAKSLLEKVKP